MRCFKELLFLSFINIGEGKEEKEDKRGKTKRKLYEIKAKGNSSLLFY
jgi:hypothetical protein